MDKSIEREALLRAETLLADAHALIVRAMWLLPTRAWASGPHDLLPGYAVLRWRIHVQRVLEDMNLDEQAEERSNARSPEGTP